MINEGGEHARGKNEGHDIEEPPETKETPTSAQEMMRELRGEIEDETEPPEAEESSKSAEEVVKDARAEVEERGGELPTSDEDVEGDQEIPGEAEQCVQDAIQELSQREQEAREQEAEKQEEPERAYNKREETADEDTYEDLEREFLKDLEEKGGDAEDTKEQWREQCVKDIEEYLQESKDEQESDNKQEEGERSGQSSTAESSSHCDDGSGQMYEVRTKSEAESTTEAELEPKSEQPETAPETVDSAESESKRESAQTDEPYQEKETEGAPETQEHSNARDSSEEGIQERIIPQDEAIKDHPEGKISSERHEKSAETVHNETEAEKTEKVRTERVYYESRVDEETSCTSEKSNGTELEQPVVNEKEADAEVSQVEESREEANESEEESVEDKFWKKRLLELYEEMPEEWKEAFREYLRGLVEDEDDFERLAEKHGLDYLLEDEEVMEELRRFLKFKQALGEQGEENIEKIAEELGIDSDLAEQWASGEVEPQALKDVLNHEAYWTFWELVRHKLELDSPNTEEELETILKENPMLELADPMLPFEQWKRDARAWIEIMNAKKRGEIGVRLRNSREIYHREDIERLSEKYGIPKMEIVSWLRGERVPILIKRISPYQRERNGGQKFHLIDAYSSLYFYFRDRASFEEYILKVAGALGIGGHYKDCLAYLEKLASKTIPSPSKTGPISARYLRIKGSHVKLFNAILGMHLSELEGKIVRLTGPRGKGGIRNPGFPEGETLLIALTRILATVLSDGHLKPNGTVEYSEPELSRIRLVEQNLRNFGDIRLQPRFIKKDNYYRSYFPIPVGEILKHLGMISGDKSIHNQHIPPAIVNGSLKVVCAFFEDFIPQDGSANSRRISLAQSNSLHPGNKIKDYPQSYALDQRLVRFIIRHGDPKRTCIILSRKKLVRLMKSKNQIDSKPALELNEIIYQNHNKVAVDSIRMAKMVGVDMSAKPYTIRYFKKTKKVTVAWVSQTMETYEMVKLAMIAPPNDVNKRRVLKKALENRKELVMSALKHFANRGIVVEEWWKK